MERGMNSPQAKKGVRNVILLLFLLFCSLPVYAQMTDLIINADDLSYDKEHHLVEAKGSVEVIYEDVTVYGEHIIYNTKTEIVTAKNGFVINYEGITVEGKAIDYEVKKKAGKVKDFNFTYQGIELNGKQMLLGKEKFKLKNASFTTCDLGEPHYHLSAGEIILYPKYGWLVAYWGFFWLGRFPVVPVPTYVYDVMAEERGRKNLPPFPEISSNDEDGVFVNERLAWHIRRELSGSYSINYATKKGVGAGIDANYIINEQSMGNARFHGNITDGVWTGITHRLFFGNEVEGVPESPFNFFAQPTFWEYEFITNLSYRERINYQRVSTYPDLFLNKNRGSILFRDLRYDASLFIGIIEEENNINLSRGGGKLDLYWEIPEFNFGEVIPSLSLDSSFYSNGDKWVKTLGGIEYRKSLFGFLSMKLGYLHHFSVDGMSPFLFEMYRFNPADRLTSGLLLMFDGTGVGLHTSYFLDTWSPEDIDYSIYFRLHCYNLIAKYRSLRNEFSLGFSLAGGE
jgi:lipopolysaccharide export system protein LptA